MVARCIFAVLIAGFGVLVPVSANESAPPDSAPPEQPAAHTLVIGQAYDHVGAGVHDATVTVKLKATDAVIGTANTNELGDIKVTAAAAYTGTAIVTVSKPFHKDHVEEVELGAESGPPFIDARMVGDITMAGVVTDVRDSRPIAGAQVVAAVGYDEFTADTDSNGAFRIDGLAPGRARLTVEADGFARQRLEIEKTEAAGALAIALSPERIVHLAITDETKRPIAGVDVECVDQQANDYRHQISDAAGRVVVRGLRFELTELAVRLTHPEYISGTDFDRAIVVPADAHVSTHGLTMEPAGIVTGVVTAPDGKEPVMGARVSAGEVLSDYLPQAWTDMEGRYRIVGVPPGKTVVTVHAAGYAPQLAEVAVAPRTEARLDLCLAPGRTITGTILDPDGKPVPDVHVTATRWRGWDTLGLQALSGADGAFQITGAPPDGFEVALYADGFKPLLDEAIAAGRERFDFQLQPDPRTGPGVRGGGPPAGQAAPDFTLTTLSGEKLSLADLRGKVVLLDFWATWCGPCLGEIPTLRQVYEAFGERDDFAMISVSLDEDAGKLAAFVKAKKMDWRHAVGHAGGATAAADAYQVSAIPAVFLIGPDGTVVAGDLHGPQLENAIESALQSVEGAANKR